MKIKLFALIFGISFFICTEGYAQVFIAVDIPSGAKRYRFYEGNFIRFRLKNGKVVNGFLSSIDSSIFTINKTKYSLTDIKKVRVKKNLYGLNLAATLFTIAGAGSLGIGTLNGLVNKDSPVLNDNQLISGFSLLGLGFVASLLNRRTINIKEDWQLKVIDLDISENQP